MVKKVSFEMLSPRSIFGYYLLTRPQRWMTTRFYVLGTPFKMGNPHI